MILHLLCLTNSMCRQLLLSLGFSSLNTHTSTHTQTCLQCEPASGCCCLMGLCPPAGPPALPQAGWGPAPGSHYISSSAGTDGSEGILPGARHAVPRSDAAPLASGGQQNKRGCKYLSQSTGLQKHNVHIWHRRPGLILGQAIGLLGPIDQSFSLFLSFIKHSFLIIVLKWLKNLTVLMSVLCTHSHLLNLDHNPFNLENNLENNFCF